MAATRNRPSPDPARLLRRALREGLARAAGALGRQGLADFGCTVALSGGRDSVVLLHALAALRDEAGAGPTFRLSALHVHHGLSPDADAWAAFCQEFCKLWTVPLTVERVVVDRASGQGIEGAARTARHAAFACADADLVVLAHHAGDQAETLLFNLLRGSGLNGLTAMAPLRSGHTGPALLRPWLDIPPEAIEDYRAHFGLAHVVDASNRDTGFSRNFLRHEVLAPLEQRFPGAVVRVAGAARRLGEARALLADVADADLAGIADSGCIALAGLVALDPRRQRNAMRRWLERRATGLSEDGLDELFRQLAGASPDAQINLRCGPVELRLWRGRLHAVDGVGPRAFPAAMPWRGEAALGWGGGTLHFDPAPGEGLAERFADGLELRPRQGGERIRLREGGPTRALRILYQESAVPPWVRASMPLVFRGDVLVAVPGIGVAAGFAALPGETGRRLRWVA